MENFRINKICPFCPQKSYSYHYKRFYGLLRHVLCEHARTKHGWYKRTYPEKIEILRCYFVKYSKFKDFKINGREHLETLLFEYCKNGKNPSLRTLRIKSLKNLF